MILFVFQVIVLSVVIGLALSRPQAQEQQEPEKKAEAEEVTILRSENENNGDGTFRWLSELSDGTKMEQSGYLKPGEDPENGIQVIQGSYSYYSPEGGK